MLDGDVIVPGALAMRARGALGHALRRAEAARDRLLRERAPMSNGSFAGLGASGSMSCRAPAATAMRGYSSGNGVVVADVSRLNGVRSRARARRSARAQSSFSVYAALAKHGVTIPGGSCPTVGIAGLALGGGVGYSSRRFGTTADNLARLQIVTADGELLVCDASHHADLFWACRGGGGGNFGIVTELHVRDASGLDGVDLLDRVAVGAGCAGARRVAAVRAARTDALFSVLDLIATDPSTPGARAHVVSAGQYFGPESDLSSLLQPLTSVGTPIRVDDADARLPRRRRALGGLPRRGDLHGSRARRSRRSPTTSPRRSRRRDHDARERASRARQGHGRGALYFDASRRRDQSRAEGRDGVRPSRRALLDPVHERGAAARSEPGLARESARADAAVCLGLCLPELHRPAARHAGRTRTTAPTFPASARSSGRSTRTASSASRRASGRERGPTGRISGG